MIKNIFFRQGIVVISAFVILFTMATPGGILAAGVSTLNTPASANDNPTTNTFSLVSCDGPAELGRINGNKVTITVDGKTTTRAFVPCDFNGAVTQVQHLINAAIALGVLFIVIGSAYAGYLYITGTQDNIKKAKQLLMKMVIGFVIMLCAWFIVFQILSWLTGSQSAATYLLGK